MLCSRDFFSSFPFKPTGRKGSGIEPAWHEALGSIPRANLNSTRQESVFLVISRADPARMKGTDAGEGRPNRAVLEWPRPTAWGKTSGSGAGEHFSILTKPRRGR